MLVVVTDWFEAAVEELDAWVLHPTTVIANTKRTVITHKFLFIVTTPHFNKIHFLYSISIQEPLTPVNSASIREGPLQRLFSFCYCNGDVDIGIIIFRVWLVKSGSTLCHTA